MFYVSIDATLQRTQPPEAVRNMKYVSTKSEFNESSW